MPNCDVLTFYPGLLTDGIYEDLPGTLRMLADAIAAGAVQVRRREAVISGFGCGNDEVAVRVVLQLNVPLQRVRARPTELPGGSEGEVKA